LSFILEIVNGFRALGVVQRRQEFIGAAGNFFLSDYRVALGRTIKCETAAKQRQCLSQNNFFDHNQCPQFTVFRAGSNQNPALAAHPRLVA
jgi:hypothetical protein